MNQIKFKNKNMLFWVLYGGGSNFQIIILIQEKKKIFMYISFTVVFFFFNLFKSPLSLFFFAFVFVCVFFFFFLKLFEFFRNLKIPWHISPWTKSAKLLLRSRRSYLYLPGLCTWG